MGRLAINAGLIALEGNHLGELLEFFGDVGYRLAGVEWLPTDDAAKFLAAAAPGEIVKATYYDTRWTVIVDPEMAIHAKETALAAYAAAKSCRICTCLCADPKHTLALYSAQGQILRAIDTTGKTIDRNIGEPLKGEPDPLCLDEPTTLALFARIATRYDHFDEEREYTVYTLTDKERDVRALLNKTKKPWWKFW